MLGCCGCIYNLKHFSNVSAVVPHLVSFSFSLWGADKGSELPLLSERQAVFFIQTMFHQDHETQCNGFPCYFKVFAQYCIKIPYTSGESHCIKFRGLVDKFLLTMSLWKKASAVVGLSGLTPREVVRGALTCPEFQKMPDPLDRDPFGLVVVKAEVRNTVLYSVILNLKCRTYRNIR